MNIRYIVYLFLAIAGVFSGCEKDNFEEPKSTLAGRVVFENQPVGVRTPNVNSDGTSSNGVQLELWQPGYQVYSKIPVFVNQDGSFSASLFDGDYKLVLLRGTGPWVDNTDTINVQVRGTTTIDVPVQPYYTIRNEAFARNGNDITATCKVDQVLTTRNVERVILYLGATQFVDSNNNVSRVEKSGADVADLSQNLAFTMSLPAAVANKEYCFARIAVKTVGVSEMLYTPVQKIQLR